ncbi:MAG: hypothetical protein GXX79_08100 [Actinomycetales bacterium]|nr:hypothetical protein [Actinomycetales bacterium]
MPIILTVDQRRSRRRPDRVPEAIARLQGVSPRRRFERTAGDEFQGVLDDPTTVVDTVLRLVRDGWWSVGVGIGPVEEPLPSSTRAGRGPGFLLAREAVEAAKRRPQRLAVRSPVRALAHDAEAMLTLLAAIVQRRSGAGWQAVDLLAHGLTIAQAAERLGVTRQAIGQRLGAALWQQEQEARPVAARLITRALDGEGDLPDDAPPGPTVRG